MSLCRFLAALGLAAALQPASAETVYRCAGGYSQAPCAGGTALEAADERSPEQRAQSAAAARRDAQLAERLQQERLQQEAQPPSAYIPATGRAKVAAPEPARRKTARTKPSREPALFTATAPGKESTKKKAAPKKKPAAG